MTNIDELKKYIDELQNEITDELYSDLTNIADEIETEFTCQEDLKDWLVRNWTEVEETISKTLDEMIDNQKLDMSDIADRDTIVETISEDIKEGIFREKK